MPAAPSATLTVPSDLQFLPVVRQFIESFCRLGGMDQESMDAIVLAANEATSNIIRHTYQGQAHEQIQIQCRLLPDGVEVTLSDEGEPFNVCDVPDLDPAEMRVGGRGIFLMRTLVDELVCSPRQDGGNVLRMVRRKRN